MNQVIQDLLLSPFQAESLQVYCSGYESIRSHPSVFSSNPVQAMVSRNEDVDENAVT